MSITDPMPRDVDADSPEYQAWYSRERARIQANRERVAKQTPRTKAAPTAAKPMRSRQAAQAVPAPTAKTPTVTVFDKARALQEQEPGLPLENAIRRVAATDPEQFRSEVGSLPRPVAATPAPVANRPKVWDRANALRAQNPGMGDTEAMKRVQAEDPETFARFQRGEDV